MELLTSGIIIDGAIIIVEYVLYAMTLKREKLSRLSGNDLQLEKDNISQVYSSKMMRSAIFGQLIILIVFIPILTLSGVEGKMFIPMAITFSFALVGAMILSLTYVPAMAALFLKPQNPSPNSFANRIHRFIEKIYEPVFDFAMNSKKLVIGAALVFLGISFLYFFNPWEVSLFRS